MTRNDQHSTYKNITCGNKIITAKHWLQKRPQWINNRRKYNIQNDIEKILGKDCEVTNVIKFLKEFDKIWTSKVGDEISSVL